MSIQPLGPAASQAVTAQTEQATRSPPAEAGTAVQANHTTAPQHDTREPSFAQVQEAAKQVQDIVQNKASNLVFALDKDSGKTIVKVIDSQTKEVLRQIPSKEMLALAQALDQMQESHGVLIKSKA